MSQITLTLSRKSSVLYLGFRPPLEVFNCVNPVNARNKMRTFSLHFETFNRDVFGANLIMN